MTLSFQVERWPRTARGRETSGKALPGAPVPPSHPAGTSAAPVPPVLDSKEAKERERMCPEHLLCARPLGRPAAGALPSHVRAHPAKLTPWPPALQTPTARRPPTPPRAPGPHSSRSLPAPKSRS